MVTRHDRWQDLIPSGALVAVALISMAFAPVAAAQQAASGIAGVARDTSGAVLPGVTVEASSPALIEKVRVVVTDGEGRYNVVDLPPGNYTVKFTLPGFAVFQRDGIVLRAGFTANVDSQMRVGALEETVTVSGAAPLVDTANVRQQSEISLETLRVLPSSRAAVSAMISMTPGVSGQNDVGGTAGAWAREGTTGSVDFRGKGGLVLNYNGLGTTAALGNGNTGYLVNPFMAGEIVVQQGAGSAEVGSSQLTMNAVPREGSNTFNVNLAGTYTNHNLQGNNLTDDLRAMGVTSVDSVRYLYDAGGSVGGPILQNRLWYLGSLQRIGIYNYEANNYYNATQGTPFYTPDFSRPADQLDEEWRAAIRTTWQATPRNKVAFAYERQKLNEHKRRAGSAPEAAINYRHRRILAQGTWNSPVSNRLLLEAAAGTMIFDFPTYPQPEVDDPATAVSILELTTGYRYNTRNAYTFYNTERRSGRASLSYVTGSHAFKVGMQLEPSQSNFNNGGVGPQPHIAYRFVNAVPSAIDLSATPYITQQRAVDLGIYAQDQWAVGRFTLNYGVRYDYLNGHVPEQTIPATRFLPERHYDKVEKAPLWRDISPRLGVAYDLFGDGRTAIKGSVGRYVIKETLALNSALNPVNTSVNAARRTWTDLDGDYVPDCVLETFAPNGECGPVAPASFGQPRIITVYDEDIREGFGVRPYNWDMSLEVQHQITPGLSATGGYYRSVFSHSFSDINGANSANFVTDNILVSPEDYDPFCITAPTDPRLPNGGGYQVCGLYDVKPAKFGLTQNVTRQPSAFGGITNHSDFFSVNLRSQFGSGAVLSGGFDTGRKLSDTCNLAVDSPQDLLYCRQRTPWGTSTQVKVQASYPLPAEFVVSGVFQNIPGPVYAADYTVSNDQIAPSLGRNLAACGARAVCSATVSVPLIEPNTFSLDRHTQLDLRLSKVLRFNGSDRLQLNLDIYNALNANSLLNVNSSFGPRWLLPLAGGTGATSVAVVSARLFQISGTYDF